MKKLLTALTAAGLALSLSGCSQAIDPKKLEISLSILGNSDIVAGDKILFASKISKVSDLGQVYSAQLEIQDETGDWVKVESKPKLQGTSDKKFGLQLEKSGTFTYRVSVIDSSAKVIKASKPVSFNVVDIAGGIRKLYYDERTACVVSSDKCVDFMFQNDYPGLHSLSKSYISKVKQTVDFSESDTPNLSTITPDPTWVYPTLSCEAKLIKKDISQPLPGRTYSVQTDASGSNPSFTSHVTLLNGKIYYYPYVCY
jgi:hypothetical protein